jgi:hypothetical protein
MVLGALFFFIVCIHFLDLFTFPFSCSAYMAKSR